MRASFYRAAVTAGTGFAGLVLPFAPGRLVYHITRVELVSGDGINGASMYALVKAHDETPPAPTSSEECFTRADAILSLGFSNGLLGYSIPVDWRTVHPIWFVGFIKGLSNHDVGAALEYELVKVDRAEHRALLSQ